MAWAQTTSATDAPAWETCARTAGDAARLACFDQWARTQARGAAGTAALPGTVPPASAAASGAVVTTPQQAQGAATTAVATAADAPVAKAEDPVIERCHDTRYSELSRFWELESGTDCGRFGVRGYRPIGVAIVQGSSVNKSPSSPAEGHQSTTSIDYRNTENRIQLSVRTKFAQGLFTGKEGTAVDSLWFGYTQQSYWQLFTPQLSRPFRATDHEPEAIYVYPTDFQLPGGWRMRYTGVGAVHQSNGQNLPLSRSWNRVYLMAGMEKDTRFRITGRVWHRLHEDADTDDNPGIENYIGRGEVTGAWTFNPDNTFSATVRSNLKSDSKGSLRVEWLRSLGPREQGGLRGGLRLHTALFTGYGDSLIDYNRKRTVFSVGLSLVDF
jgi:phospholipase A1